jgi:hypothetical protein
MLTGKYQGDIFTNIGTESRHKMTKIDKGVPIPEPIKGTRPKSSPMYLLEVGDSFFSERKYASTCVSHYAAKLGRKFVSRTVTENGVKGKRIWRTK